MEWNIAPHSRVDLHVFSGINFSGERRLSCIHPAGGLQKSRLKNFQFRSIAIVGRPGTRVILCTSVLDIGWESRPWRAMVIKKSDGYRMKDGKLAIRIPRPRLARSGQRPPHRPRFPADLSPGRGPRRRHRLDLRSLRKPVAPGQHQADPDRPARVIGACDRTAASSTIRPRTRRAARNCLRAGAGPQAGALPTAPLPAPPCPPHSPAR